MSKRTKVFNLAVVVLLALTLAPQPLRALSEADVPDGAYIPEFGDGMQLISTPSSTPKTTATTP